MLVFQADSRPTCYCPCCCTTKQYRTRSDVVLPASIAAQLHSLRPHVRFTHPVALEVVRGLRQVAPTVWDLWLCRQQHDGAC